MEGVVYHAQSLYSCSQDAQKVIKEMIQLHNLNRVVIAACSPRTHEPLFQETLKDAGLNRNMFEMVNIRDHCSWVHANEPEQATMQVHGPGADGRCQGPPHPAPAGTDRTGDPQGHGHRRRHRRHDRGPFPGRSGLSIPRSSRRTAELGGHLREQRYTLDGRKTADFLKTVTDRIAKNKQIEVFTDSRLATLNGFVGNFSSVVKTSKGKKEVEQTIDHGVMVVATGGREHRPETGAGQAAAEIEADRHPARAGAAAGRRQGQGPGAEIGGDDPVRRFPGRRSGLLQQDLLHPGGQKRPEDQGNQSRRPGHRPLPRHADLRLCRGRLSRGPRERGDLHPLQHGQQAGDQQATPRRWGSLSSTRSCGKR